MWWFCADMLNSYPWYISDWRESETRNSLTLSQRGLYRELLDYCYLEGSLPGDRSMLFRIAGCSAMAEAEHSLSTPRALAVRDLSSARARLGHDLSTVLALFKLDESTGRYHHPKVDETLPKLFSYHKQKSHAGIKSGQARRERALNGRSEVVDENREPCTSTCTTPSKEEEPPPTPLAGGDIAIPELSAEIGQLNPPEKPKRSRSGHRTTEEIEKALGPERKIWWENFWRTYPCGEGMNAGMDAFERKVHTRELAVELYHGAQRYAERVGADPTMKVKFPQGWINGERWKDANEIRPVEKKGLSLQELADSIGAFRSTRL